MRALLVHEPNGPQALRLSADVPDPEPGPGTVAIDVAAAGVAFPDLLLTRGEYQYRPDPPFSPGSELAGTVAALGDGVEGLAVGDRVCALTTTGGGFAERVVVAASSVLPIPAGLSDVEAAGFVMNWHTAHFALAHRGRLQPGETVLVHGAGGGLGSASVQVARGLGAGTVIAVARTGAKADAAREAGADEVLDPDGEWAAAVKRRVDVVADPVGGERFVDSLRSLRPDGRLLVLGFADDQKIPEVRVNRLLLSNTSVIGVGWGMYLFEHPELLAPTHDALTEMVAAGHVRPLVGATYPFERAADALEDLAARRAVGKLVLLVR